MSDRAKQLEASTANRATLCAVLAQREDQVRELQARLDAAEEQDSEYTRTLEVAVTAASLLPEKWCNTHDFCCNCEKDIRRMASELQAALAGTINPNKEK